MTSPFDNGLPLLKTLNESGYEAYFVGGSVRDFLLGRKIEDIDIATSAKPEEVKSIFSKTVDVGIEHGTVLVISKGEGFEITTFRKESDYLDYRRPQAVEFITSLEEDLKRRDFTINAMAMDYAGKLFDPFDGKIDLKKKLIRCVGDPSQRFQEDALRIMRAVRFQSQLGFTIEEETKMSLQKLAPLLENIAIERILIEWNKLLDGRYKAAAFETLLDTGLHQHLPCNQELTKGLSGISHLEVNELDYKETWVLFLYTSDVLSPYSLFKKWKMSKAMQKEIFSLLTWLRNRIQQEWSLFTLYQAGLEQALKVNRVLNCIKGQNLSTSYSHLTSKYETLPIKGREDLCVNGHDLLQWTGKKSGPWIKEMIEKIEKAVIERKINNNKETIKEWLFGEFK